MTPTDDGMLAIHALLSGLDAETVATAIHAFRRPDAPGITRTPEQATADAIVDMAAAALRAAEAPATHGIRPHVTVDLDYEALLRQAGVAETVWMGPLPFAEIRRLLADCGVSRLLVDPDAPRSRPAPRPVTSPTGSTAGCCAATAAASASAVTHRRPGATSCTSTTPTGSKDASHCPTPPSGASSTTADTTSPAGRSPGSTDAPPSTHPDGHPNHPHSETTTRPGRPPRNRPTRRPAPEVPPIGTHRRDLRTATSDGSSAIPDAGAYSAAPRAAHRPAWWVTSTRSPKVADNASAVSTSSGCPSATSRPARSSATRSSAVGSSSR
jgi:hypothetical protein